jgi:hypothetical protein
VKHFQNNKYWNPSGRPLAILDKYGLITNGEEVFKWDYRPHIGVPPLSPSIAKDLVPTPIVTPNGSYIYPDGNDRKTGEDEKAREGEPNNSTKLDFSRVFEKLANEHEQLKLSETHSSTPLSLTELHPAFGTGSSLSSIASSSRLLIEDSPIVEHEEQQTVSPATGVTVSGSTPNGEVASQRYSFRKLPAVNQVGRSQNATPLPGIRVKENAGGGDLPPGPAPEHPYHRTRLPVSAKSQMPPTLKRAYEGDGSNASLQGISTTIDATPSHDRSEEYEEGSSQRTTRSRAHKVRKVDNRD